MLSVYLYLHFRQSFISVAVCIPKYRHWKGKGFRAEYSPQEEDSARNDLSPDLSTFKGWCTTFADEQRKGANDGIGKLIYRRLMIDQIKFYPAIYVEIRTVANSLPRSWTFRINFLFLADYEIIPKILFTFVAVSRRKRLRLAILWKNICEKRHASFLSLKT